MKLSDGDKVARTEVTKYLSSYIKQHNLKSQENGRVIVPNEELGNLLGAKEDETITFFNLQRFMNKHFINHSSENVVETA
jgi:chromatin remodeling complex protein RSC6